MGNTWNSLPFFDRRAEDEPSDKPSSVEAVTSVTPGAVAGPIKDTHRRLYQGEHSQTATTSRPTNVTVASVTEPKGETKTLGSAEQSQVPLCVGANVSTVLVQGQPLTSLTSTALREGRGSTSSTRKTRHSTRTKKKRKTGTTHKGQHALTVDNILKELKEVKWEKLHGGGILQLPTSQMLKIEEKHPGETECKLKYWLWNHPYATWRLLITQLDMLEEHAVADQIRGYAEKLTDPTMTSDNISKVVATVREVELGDVLSVPESKMEAFRQQSSTTADYRQRLIEYFIKYSNWASWSDLAGRLYRYDQPAAVEAARAFITQTPEPSLSLTNLTTLLENINDEYSNKWWNIGFWLNIPASKRSAIDGQYSIPDQCSCACWDLYITGHPSPTWKGVAYALYQEDCLEKLEVVQKKYLKGTAENRRQFTGAMESGHIRVWLSKLLMYGAAGSGKTSTKEMIVGNPPPAYRESTPLAMRPTTVYRVSIEGKEFAKLTTLEERKMFLARAMVNIDPDLVVDLLKAQYIEASTTTTEPVSTDEADPQVKTKEQSSSPAKSMPSPSIASASVQPTRSDSVESLSSDEASDIDSKVDSILQSISTDKELVKMMDELSQSVHPLAAFRMLQIIDSGGQPQFHEILPIFLRRLYFYVFVFRLCDDLSSRPQVEYYVDGKPVGKSFTSSQTIEQLLQHCARTMHSHRSSSGSEGECPQIMIIGTHLDQEKRSSETRKQKNTTILKLLLPTLRKQIVYRDVDTKDVIFALNARTPGNEEKVTIEQVRDVLLSKALIPPVDIPVKWFALEILLEEMAQALKQGVINRQVCFSAAVEKLHFEDDAAEFDAAIQYLDELSVLFYYPHILPEVIFADPQVILDKVTELVLASFQRCDVTGKGDDWRMFYEFALVTLEFLSQKEFSKHYVPGVFEVNDLVDLFTKLLIFAKFNATQLFVPALLRDLGKEEVDKHRLCSPNLPSFAIQFPDGGPRKGIFCSLLCWLASPENSSSYKWSIFVDEIGAPICLYRNCVLFKLSDSPATVTLIDTYTHFELHIDIEEEWVDKLCPKIIPKVREVIFKGLHKASINLCYYNSSPKPALVCPCGEGDTHIATGNIELECWTCGLSRPKRKCGMLTSHQLTWLNSSTNSDTKRLAESDMTALFGKLDSHAHQWRDIATYLGFQQTELDNIQGRALLLQGSPQSWLRAMLSEWLQWAPNDSRGSSSFATLQALKDALYKSGLGATASTL